MNAAAVDLARRVRDALIRDGLAEVEQAYAEGTPERVGAVRGFLICETLATPEDFQDVLRERRDEEVRIVTGSTSSDDLSSYWEFRYATLQVEYVYDRLRVVWEIGPFYSASAVVKVAEVLERITGYSYDADVARGSSVREPGERPGEAAARLRRERDA